MRTAYGMTLLEYEEMLTIQKGVCAVCGSAGGGRGVTRTLAVDHCHKTGTVRGLLCPQCNVALGMVKDNASTLAALAMYLEKHRE